MIKTLSKLDLKYLKKNTWGHFSFLAPSHLWNVKSYNISIRILQTILFSKDIQWKKLTTNQTWNKNVTILSVNGPHANTENTLSDPFGPLVFNGK